MNTKEFEDKPAVTFLWQIKNFSYWETELHGAVITSPAFKALSLDGSVWYLRLRPKGEDENDKHLRLNLLLYYKECGFPLDCEWSFMDCNGLPLATGVLRNQNIRGYGSLDLIDCPTQEEVFVTKRSTFLHRDTLMVRCRLWKSRGDLLQAEHLVARTRMDVVQCSFMWAIPGISRLKLEQKVMTSVELNFIHGLETLKMDFSLTGDSLEDSTVNLKMTADKFIQGLVMTIKLSVLDNKHQAIKCVEESYRFCEPSSEQTWIFSKFLSRKELMEKVSEYMNDDVLSLFFEISYNEGGKSEVIKRTYRGPWNLKEDIAINATTLSEVSNQTSQQNDDFPDHSIQQRNDSVSILLDDFLSLYQEQTLSDFELRSGDVSFQVHKMVLSARSPVFRAMFSSDMKESTSKFLNVPDLDSHTLNRILTFLYSGTVDDLQWESAAKLYYAADKYQVPSLKRECSCILRSNISVSNVCDILVLADRHQDEELTSFVHDFILSRFEEIMNSDEWETFLDGNPLLGGKTTHELCKKKFHYMKNS